MVTALGLLASAVGRPGEGVCSRPPPGAPEPLCPAAPPPPSMMEYSLDGHNVSLSAIRTVRVLRPLRAINRVPSK